MLMVPLPLQLWDQSDLEATYQLEGALHQRKPEEEAVSAQDVFNRLSPELQRNIKVTIAWSRAIKLAIRLITPLSLQDHGDFFCPREHSNSPVESALVGHSTQYNHWATDAASW